VRKKWVSGKVKGEKVGNRIQQPNLQILSMTEERNLEKHEKLPLG